VDSVLSSNDQIVQMMKIRRCAEDRLWSDRIFFRLTSNRTFCADLRERKWFLWWYRQRASTFRRYHELLLVAWHGLAWGTIWHSGIDSMRVYEICRLRGRGQTRILDSTAAHIISKGLLHMVFQPFTSDIFGLTGNDSTECSNLTCLFYFVIL